MLQLILHLIGDYITQSNWMAVNKTTRWTPAITHALIYALPFFILTNVYGVCIIGITHLFIDRFRLIKYVLQLKEFNFKNEFGYPKTMPPYLSVWLTFISDNTIHLLINYIVIATI